MWHHLGVIVFVYDFNGINILDVEICERYFQISYARQKFYEGWESDFRSCLCGVWGLGSGGWKGRPLLLSLLLITLNVLPYVCVLGPLFISFTS